MDKKIIVLMIGQERLSALGHLNGCMEKAPIEWPKFNFSSLLHCSINRRGQKKKENDQEWKESCFIQQILANIIIGNVWENNVLDHNINPEIEN